METVKKDYPIWFMQDDGTVKIFKDSEVVPKIPITLQDFKDRREPINASVRYIKQKMNGY